MCFLYTFRHFYAYFLCFFVVFDLPSGVQLRLIAGGSGSSKEDAISWFFMIFDRKFTLWALPSIQLDSDVFSNVFNVIHMVFWLGLMIFDWFLMAVGGFGRKSWDWLRNVRAGSQIYREIWYLRSQKSTQKIS